MTYSYDNAYQLTRERRSGANAYDVTYSYDPVGNRLTKLEGGVTTSYSYDEASQLTVEWTPSARTTYSYDANGNTQVINAAGSLTTHTWDLEDRMTKVEVAGGAVNTMTYDGDGRRRRTEDSDGLRNVIWDQENIALETDSGNSTVAQYTLAPQGYGNLISQRRSGATSHYHFDALGSTRVLTNSAQTPTDTADYRAFGQPNASSGSTVNPFRWGGRTGYYRQGDSADYWLRARIYRDLAGRFLSQDPIRAGVNPFRWPGNNPVMLADPSGLQGQCGRPGGACPYHGPSAQGWEPAGGGGGEGGHPHRHPCTPKSGCERRLTKDDWYIMCRCKEPDKRNWRCRCPHPEKWPRPPQAGMVQLVHVETCKSCSEKNAPCKCHFQLWRVPILPPRRGRRGQPFREEIVDGLCKPCGGGGGGDGPDDDGPNGGKGWVLFWLGGVADITPNLLGNISAAIVTLRDAGYNAEYVGRTRAELRAANVHRQLAGLWAGAHGGCERPTRGDSCHLNPIVVGERAYFVEGPRPVYGNDWLRVDASSSSGFVALYAIHCLGGLDLSDQDLVRQWYAMRIGQPVAKVHLCDYKNVPEGTQPSGSCYAYAESIDAFVEELT